MMQALTLFVAASLCLVSYVSAATFEVERTSAGPTLYLNDETGRHLVGKLLTLPPGTRLYHWGKEIEATQLAQQGKITQPQLDARLANPNGNQGGGFYVSMDPWDSHDYGPKLTVLELESEGVFVLTKLTHELRVHDFSSYPEYQRALREAGVQGTYYLPSVGTAFSTYEGQRWLNVIDSHATSRARAGDLRDLLGPSDFLTQTTLNKNSTHIQALLELSAQHPLILRKKFHTEYVELLKKKFASWLIPDTDGNYQAVQGDALTQWLGVAHNLGIEPKEVFSQKELERLARSFPKAELIKSRSAKTPCFIRGLSL